MIEIVYEEENRKTGAGDRVRYELPRNIRQVGNAPGSYKIYIEDYVMTYLRKIAAPGNTNCRGAILLGKVYEEEKGRVVFISGAVDAQNLEFDISLIRFGDGVWSSLYADINKYFDDLDIVGWFLSRMGFSAEINDQMKYLHKTNFPGNDKVLFLMDSLECDEAFYYYTDGTFVREKGYYIYYVRNEKMQNYIISRKNNTAEPAGDSVLIKDKTVVENFRTKEKREGGKKKHLGQTAVCFAAVCAISFGALWYISPDTLDIIGDKLGGKRGSGEVQVFMNSADGSGTVYDTGMAAQTTTEKYSGDENVQQNTVAANANTTSADPTSEDSANADSANAASSDIAPANTGTADAVKTDSVSDTKQSVINDTPDQRSDMNIYEVEAGDTLVSIAIKMYGDQTQADNIAAVNGLDIDSPIYEGQKLIIPYTN